jgi:hypothetical protein
MGKAILILLLGSMIIMSTLNLTMIDNVNRATDVSVEQFVQKQARLNASSMVNVSISKLSDDYDYRTKSEPQDLFYGWATTRVLDTIVAGKNLVKIASVGEVQGSTVAVTALVKLPDLIPPVMQYAILGGEDVTLNGGTPITVGDYLDPTYNANVHSNKDVVLNGDNITIEGFATYAKDITIDGKPGTIKIIPNSNPNGDPAYYKTSAVPIPNVDLKSFLTKPGVIPILKDYPMTGPLILSPDKANPTIIYIKGKLTVTGTVNVSGYGIIISEGDVEMKGNFIHNSVGVPNHSKVLIATGGKFMIGTEKTTIHASVYAKDEIPVNGKNVTVIGNLVSQKKVTLNNQGVVVLYHPISSQVSKTIFGEMPPQDRLKVVHWYE